jgi:hypothetical protein
MDQQTPKSWQQMFEPKRPAQGRAHGGYDDGFDPNQRDARGDMPRPSLTPEEITDEAAMALALDAPEYKPWVLQRGRGRPAMMLHLRRYETKSGLWCGWQIAYPHLVAVEYTGDRLLSLDFGQRQFMIEGDNLSELARHLQSGFVLMVQEYSDKAWDARGEHGIISSIVKVGRDGRAD